MPGKRRNGVLRAGAIILVIGAIVALAAYILVETIPYRFHTPQGDLDLVLAFFVMPSGILVSLLGGILLLIGWVWQHRKKQVTYE